MCTLIGACELLSHAWVGALGSALAGIAGIVAAVAALRALGKAKDAIEKQTANSVFEKMFDAIAECNRRYDSVRKLEARDHIPGVFTADIDGKPVSIQNMRVATSSPAEDVRATQYFREFWGVQMEQWEYFRLGLVPREMFFAWTVARWRDFNDGGHAVVGRYTFRQGWDRKEVAKEAGEGSSAEHVSSFGRSQFQAMLPAFVEFVDALMGLKEPDYDNQRADKIDGYRKNLEKGRHPVSGEKTEALAAMDMPNLAALVAFVERQAIQHRASIRQQLL